jgi:hypothetical protein
MTSSILLNSFLSVIITAKGEKQLKALLRIIAEAPRKKAKEA